MIELALRGETRIRGPHTRERLANAAQGTLDGAAADRTLAGVEDATSEAESEDLKDWDRVGNVL